MAQKKVNPSITIMKREVRAYFTSPIAYIVTGLYLLASGFLFFNTFFLEKRADLRGFFGILPLTLSFFIPALTMRIMAEEKRSGSFETLLTLPVTEFQIVLGKFLASFISGLSMIAPTLFYALTCFLFGKPDFAPILGGYIGAAFLTAAFSSIGLFASSVTKNQIIAFSLAFSICIVLTLISNFLIFMPPLVVNLMNYISAYSHFESISRGIIDTRDIIYFITLTALFFVLSIRAVKITGESK